MVFGIIVGIFGALFLWAYFGALAYYKEKMDHVAVDKPAGGVLGFGLVLIIICITILTLTITFNNENKRIHYETNNNKSDTKTLYCNMCGGRIECAICGDIDALYCEWASYGAGNDHYCKKHWTDVVKWHENKNRRQKILIFPICMDGESLCCFPDSIIIRLKNE